MVSDNITEILLNETYFTFVCKNGSINIGSGYDKVVINLTKSNIKDMALGNIFEYEHYNGRKFKVKLELPLEMTKEIVKRSVLYSDLYYEI